LIEIDLGLENRVILVAASSKGLGFGIAQALAKEGARLSIASRTESDIRMAASKLRDSEKCEARGYVFDASDSNSIDRWISSSIKDFGRIDGLVVNAGGPPPGTFDSFDDSDWEKAFNQTLLSAVRMIRGVLPAMRKNRYGSILTVTSSSIKEPIDNLILSNVFRSGVVSLVKTLANEVANEGIRVNNIVPGRIDTDRVRTLDNNAAQKLNESIDKQVFRQQQAIPLGRYGTIEEFGSAAAYLLSDRASYITGSTLVVDGGKAKTVW
jgi:3-oxoacyl-[acyl-carrier protein] reductase